VPFGIKERIPILKGVRQSYEHRVIPRPCNKTPRSGEFLRSVESCANGHWKKGDSQKNTPNKRSQTMPGTKHNLMALQTKPHALGPL